MMERRLAISVLNALRNGQLPESGVSEIAVGREGLAEELATLLDEITKGLSAVKFLQGSYGTGKTFLL
ncbi:MAG: BREX system ATP-binding domain-containing protein, partial [Nitrososphaerales archaeon]